MRRQSRPKRLSWLRLNPRRGSNPPAVPFFYAYSMAQWCLREEKSVAEHPRAEDFACFVSGTLSLEERGRLLRHLLKGCPGCSRLLALKGGFAPAEVAEDCYYVVISQVMERGLGAAGIGQDAVEVLTAVLSGERRWDDLSGFEIGSLRGLPRLRALLEAGRSLRHHDPQATLRFAKLARYAADRLSPKALAAKPVADLRALAWAELGNAYRICDDLPRASRAMNRAVYWSHRGSGSSLLLTRVADLLASLLGSQRRFPEASQLLFMVYQAHEKAGRRHLAGRALFSAGSVAAWQGSPATALALMRRGLDLLDHERDPVLESQVLLAMITGLADLGRFRSARRLLWRCRHLFVELGNELDLLRLRWLEGRIYAGLSDFSRAEQAFQETRAGFAKHEQVYPAAIAGLDLAALWARQGRHDEIHALAQEMIVTFRALRIAREATVTLLILQRACVSGGGQLLEIIDMVVTFLKDLERQPAKRS
jgi:tetratricopeptide (TPR) repeat protein